MALDAVGQTKPRGPGIDEGVRGGGKPGRVFRNDDHRVTLHHYPESEGGQPFDGYLFQRPRAQTVRSGPDPQTLVLDLDVDRKALSRVALILDSSFKFADGVPRVAAFYRCCRT